ncbi:MAG: recombinase family protein [Microbacterium sp.]
MPRPARAEQVEPRRGLALIRVSKERDGMTSPDVQRHAIEALAASHGITIVDTVEGLDESGSRARSAWWPRLDQAIARMEAGDIDVILVWKFSRIGRARLRWAIALDRVDTLGGMILSATEPIESTTASGKFARGLLGEVNAYQADLIGETWKETHARRVRAGLPANGKPRFGYTYMREAGFTPDPVTGPVLQAAYRRYIAGESVYSLILWLNQGPTRPVTGYGAKGDGLWSDRTLRRVMDSGFGAGLIMSDGEHHPGVHEPLITADEWDAYLEARGRRRTYRRVERSTYLLSGMVWCACESKMHAGQFGHAKTPKYRCKAAHEKRTHTGGYVTETVLNDAVYAWLVDREKRIREEVERGLHAQPPKLATDPRPQLENRLRQIEVKLDQLVEDRRTIPTASYDRLQAKYAAEHEAVVAELRTLKARAGAPIRVLPVLLERWVDLELPEKREMLRAVIERVVVTPQRPVSKVEVWGRDDG